MHIAYFQCDPKYYLRKHRSEAHGRRLCLVYKLDRENVNDYGGLLEDSGGGGGAGTDNGGGGGDGSGSGLVGDYDDYL